MVDIRLEHRVVGNQHVFTSPDLPGLYVAHPDEEEARRAVPSAIEMLRGMNKRRAERERVKKRVAASG